MPQISLQELRRFLIEDLYKRENIATDDVLIDIGIADLYAKTITHNILKSFKIDSSKVKKLVSLNQNGQLVVDNGISKNVFTSEDVLTANNRDFIKKDQLVFAEEEKNNDKVIAVYKILFNEEQNQVRPEIAKLVDLSLNTFNNYFVKSGFFNETFDELFTNLLVAENDLGNVLPRESKFWYKNQYQDKLELVNRFKQNRLNLNNINIEEGYFIYRQNDKIIIENVSDPTDKVEKLATINSISENDIFYFTKIAGQNFWSTYKLISTINNGYLYSNINYQIKQFNDLTADQFISNLQKLDIFNGLSTEQEGFVKAVDNQGLATIISTEKDNIENNAINLLAQVVVPTARQVTVVDNTSDSIRRALEAAIENFDFLYSLAIENDVLKIIDVKSNSEKIILEQKLSLNNRNTINNGYQKTYFIKDPDVDDLVRKLRVNTTVNPYQLEFIDTIALKDLRGQLANNDLFYTADPNTLNGIHLGKNGSQQAAMPAVIPKLPPVNVDKVINLKWNDNRVLWDLNVTSTPNPIQNLNGYTLNKELKLEVAENKILSDLITANKGANTVILFNKYTGEFLRAYYFDENNKKINCSDKLSYEAKADLSIINKKAKQRILEPTIVTTPVFKLNESMIAKNTKTFQLKLIKNKWHVVCYDNLNKLINAVIPLTIEEHSSLSQLVKPLSSFDLTFDINDCFKEIKYINYQQQKDTMISAKDLPLIININTTSIVCNDLMNKIITAINNPATLLPEDDGITWQPWNNKTVNEVNAPPTSNHDPQSLLQI